MEFFIIDDMPLSNHALKMTWIPWLWQPNDGRSDYVSTRMVTAFDFVLPLYKTGKVNSKQAQAYLAIVEQIYTIMFHDRTLHSFLPATKPVHEYIYDVMAMAYSGTPDNLFMGLLDRATGNEFDFLINIFVEAFTNTSTRPHQFILDHNYIPHITSNWQIMGYA